MGTKPQRVGWDHVLFRSWPLETPSKNFHLTVWGGLGWMKWLNSQIFYLMVIFSATILTFFVWCHFSNKLSKTVIMIYKFSNFGENIMSDIAWDIYQFGPISLTTPLSGFSKNVSSSERTKSWFFVTFNIILRHMFPEKFIEFPHAVQKICGNSLVNIS